MSTKQETQSQAASDRETYRQDDELNRSCADSLTAMARGDKAALTSFYRSTLGKCYALALRITGDPAAAEDVVAETYLQAWRDARRYDASRGRPLAWLLTLCRSRAIDHLRGKDSALSHPDPTCLLPPDPSALAGQGDPLAAVLVLEQSHALKTAIDALPRQARQLLALAFYRGLTHQEIAELTRLPLGTIKAQLRRAQMALRSVVDRP